MADTPTSHPPSGSKSGPEGGTPSAPEDAALVERLKLGQDWACNRLVSLYQERLLKIAYGITLDHEESREIVQDVFIKAIANIGQFRGDHGLGPWLRKITINACLNWKRKWKRRFRWHHTSLEPDTEYLVYDRASQGETPETVLREKEEEKALARAVGKLPEKIRTVFILNTLEGLSYREISQALGIREGTVSSRLFRARKMILADLENAHEIKGGTP